MRDGKGGRLKDSRREQVEHGGGLKRVREIRGTKESGKMSREELAVTINEIEANGQRSSDRRMVRRQV